VAVLAVVAVMRLAKPLRAQRLRPHSAQPLQPSQRPAISTTWTTTSRFDIWPLRLARICAQTRGLPHGFFNDPIPPCPNEASPLASHITGAVIPVDGGLRKYQF
jgi:hypothetical protein